MEALPVLAHSLRLLLPGIVIGATGLVLYVCSVVWAYRDARRRGKSGLDVALMVALLVWPLGLLLWIVFRPDGETAGTDRLD